MAYQVSMIQDLISPGIIGDELFENISFFNHSTSPLFETLCGKTLKGGENQVALPWLQWNRKSSIVSS